MSSGYGAKVACAELPFGYISSESAGGLGGTCVLRGCVPKKLVMYCSEYAEYMKDAEGFGCANTTMHMACRSGTLPAFSCDHITCLDVQHHACRWEIGESKLHWSKFMDKKRKELQRLNGVYGNIMGNAGVEIIEGRATLKDKHTVVVNGKEYTSKYICIAVGGTPHMLGLPGNHRPRAPGTAQPA